jgi:hypothetical protein
MTATRWVPVVVVLVAMAVALLAAAAVAAADGGAGPVCVGPDDADHGVAPNGTPASCLTRERDGHTHTSTTTSAQSKAVASAPDDKAAHERGWLAELGWQLRQALANQLVGGSVMLTLSGAAMAALVLIIAEARAALHHRLYVTVQVRAASDVATWLAHWLRQEHVLTRTSRYAATLAPADTPRQVKVCVCLYMCVRQHHT